LKAHEAKFQIVNSLGDNISKEITPLCERKLFLRDWDEAVGQFLRLEIGDQWLQVKMSCGSIEFPIASIEAQILAKDLEGLSGRSIAILKTDSAERPIVVRVLKEGLA